MDVKLKQRLIGAVVLTALAILIVPMFLDGDEQERARVTGKIPPRPDMQVEPFTAQDLLLEMDAMEAASTARLPRKNDGPSDRDPQDTDQLSLDANGLPLGWTLQVGSFEKEENAIQLRDRLRDGGYRAYRTSVQTDTGVTSRVLVGPMLQRKKLALISSRIEAEFGLHGQIVRYRVEDDKDMVGGGK
ncbi:MAG: SPOR domain-containing protein [Pseudomonadales bacterium]|jgi:DedD protein|nr:SPOR domain-containing protein [Pseudomonadales bacterium]MDP7358492.1 SPOR domain-containing protein [Pseudomonadales bacterium]MDP7595079.1 SPOR domain-containing protein [Pseudomonadales bacterium]HJN51281.1 SPOR domain-containing protein [Pseudomonadales bacterium]|tara:strand:+ start:552 stop:1115 length:564 start_codon:yes stop_codon:yes gene_type:complete